MSNFINTKWQAFLPAAICDYGRIVFKDPVSSFYYLNQYRYMSPLKY